MTVPVPDELAAHIDAMFAAAELRRYRNLSALAVAADGDEAKRAEYLNELYAHQPNDYVQALQVASSLWAVACSEGIMAAIDHCGDLHRASSALEDFERTWSETIDQVGLNEAGEYLMATRLMALHHPNGYVALGGPVGSQVVAGLLSAMLFLCEHLEKRGFQAKRLFFDWGLLDRPGVTFHRGAGGRPGEWHPYRVLDGGEG